MQGIKIVPLLLGLGAAMAVVDANAFTLEEASEISRTVEGFRKLDTLASVNLLLDGYVLEAPLDGGIGAVCESIVLADMDFRSRSQSGITINGEALEGREEDVDLTVSMSCTVSLAFNGIPVQLDVTVVELEVTLALDFFMVDFRTVIPKFVRTDEKLNCAANLDNVLADFEDQVTIVVLSDNPDIVAGVGAVAPGLLSSNVCLLLLDALDDLAAILTNNIVVEQAGTRIPQVEAAELGEASLEAEAVIIQNLPAGYKALNFETIGDDLAPLILNLLTSPLIGALVPEITNFQTGLGDAFPLGPITDPDLVAASLNNMADILIHLETNVTAADFLGDNEVIITVVFTLDAVFDAFFGEGELSLEVLLGLFNLFSFIPGGIEIDLSGLFGDTKLEDIVNLIPPSSPLVEILSLFDLNLPLNDVFTEVLNFLEGVFGTGLEISVTAELNSITSLLLEVLVILDPEFAPLQQACLAVNNLQPLAQAFAFTFPVEIADMTVVFSRFLFFPRPIISIPGFFSNSLILPPIGLDRVDVEVDVNVVLSKDGVPIVSDLVTIAGDFSVQIAMAIPAGVDYTVVDDFSFANLVDLNSAIPILLEFAIQFLSGFALSLSKTSISGDDLGVSISSVNGAFDGFVEDVVDNLSILYGPILLTYIENAAELIPKGDFVTLRFLGPEPPIPTASPVPPPVPGTEPTPNEEGIFGDTPISLVAAGFACLGVALLAIVIYFVTKPPPAHLLKDNEEVAVDVKQKVEEPAQPPAKEKVEDPAPEKKVEETV